MNLAPNSSHDAVSVVRCNCWFTRPIAIMPDVVCKALPFINWIDIAEGTHSAALSSSTGAGIGIVYALLVPLTGWVMSTARMPQDADQNIPFAFFRMMGAIIAKRLLRRSNVVVVTTVYGPTGLGSPGSTGMRAFSARMSARAPFAVLLPPNGFFTVAPAPGASTAVALARMPIRLPFRFFPPPFFNRRAIFAGGIPGGMYKMRV